MLSSCKLLSFPSKFHFLNESHTMSTRMDEMTFVATWDETGSVGVIHLTKTELEEYVTSAGSHNGEQFTWTLINDVVTVGFSEVR